MHAAKFPSPRQRMSRSSSRAQERASRLGAHLATGATLQQSWRHGRVPRHHTRPQSPRPSASVFNISTSVLPARISAARIPHSTARIPVPPTCPYLLAMLLRQLRARCRRPVQRAPRLGEEPGVGRVCVRFTPRRHGARRGAARRSEVEGAVWLCPKWPTPQSSYWALLPSQASRAALSRPHALRCCCGKGGVSCPCIAPPPPFSLGGKQASTRPSLGDLHKISLTPFQIPIFRN